MKISVVIPAYNEEYFLPKVLKSLQDQTFTLPYEVIVVDNTSTDNTAEIAKSYGARVISEEKKGYAHACNAGFFAAKGEIIARADADYIQPKDWLEKIWYAFQKDSKLIALGGPLYPLESHFWENIFYYPGIVLWMYILKILGRGFLFPNMAVRKDVFIKTGGFNTSLTFGEDTEICLKLKSLGKVAYKRNIYVYTSIRRMRSLGIIESIVGYSIGNQIAMWLGKEATVGVEPVRLIPSSKPKMYKPWIFLYAVPATLLIVLLFTSSLFIPQTTTQQMVHETIKLAEQSDKALQKRIQYIKSNFPIPSIFSLKEI